MPERETPRQAAERELRAVREEVRQLTENMRARLADDESTVTEHVDEEPDVHRTAWQLDERP
ncbi:hypothetical protein [Kribbella sp.]|uniref:hypothetical protein n=1 Tax=Kribbella sp. TaxID=1871183 RepID=UPI002D5E18BE|nr:hypothetical protein [Kribbella sp.]HZX07487.1 hypothetical protein [Kribbella sp.]